MLGFVDHLHENFDTPCSINSHGRYNVPTNPDEGYTCVFLACSLPRGTDPTFVLALRCTNPALPNSSGFLGPTGLDPKHRRVLDRLIFVEAEE